MDDVMRTDPMETSIKQLLTSEDAKQQLERVKSITAHIKKSMTEDEPDVFPVSVSDAVEAFITIYLEADSQHPIKRVISSCLQSLPRGLHNSIRDALCRRIKLHICRAKELSIAQLRHHVNIIAGLLNNFPLGELCLQEMLMEVGIFLAEALEIFHKCYSPILPPIELNEVMTHCHVTLQTTNKMLQKSLSVEKCFDKSWVRDMACHILTSANTILHQEKFLLDTQCGAGISLGLFLNLLAKTEVIPLILHCVFPKLEADHGTAAPDWLLSSGSCQLSSHDLCLTSHLCLCQGLLAVLEPEDLLTEFVGDQCLLIDVLLEEFLSVSHTQLDTAAKLLVAKSLVLWTTRALSILESYTKADNCMKRFLGPGPVVQKLLNYAWNSWEDTLDAIRANSRQIFDKAVRLHLLASQAGKDDPFLLSLATPLLSLSWSVVGKYGPLICLVDHLGARCLFKIHPQLPDRILQAFEEQALASHASELFEKLCGVHLEEVREAGEGERGWEETWLGPLLAVLCGTNRAQKLNVLEYVLPRLLRIKKNVLSSLIGQLSAVSSGGEPCDGQKLGALIMCMRRARATGLLPNHAKSGPEMFGLIHTSLLKQALSSQDEQMGMDAFALLCENKKTSEPIGNSQFELIKFFLQWNMNNQSPSFRQSLLCFLKKLLSRMGESAAALLRKSKQREAGHHYKEFAQWLLRHLLNCLFPGAGFARTTTALSALSMIIDMLPSENTASNTLFRECLSLHKVVTDHDIRSLLECLTDKFEDNKIHTYRILCYLTQTTLSAQLSVEWLSVLFECGLTLSVSTKPQDCTTAAYVFRLLVKQPNSLRLMTQRLQNKTGPLREGVGEPSLTAQATYIGDKTGCGDKTGGAGIGDNTGEAGSVEKTDEADCMYVLIKLLLESLGDQLTVARRNLLQAARSGPLYPVLHCIRYLLTDFLNSHQPTNEAWRCLLADLISKCCDAARIVSPVVQNSSPEGNIPLEAIKGTGLELVCDSPEENAPLTECSLMPEYLVVCCWRTTKEVSLLLGQVAVQAPIQPPGKEEAGEGLISYQQILTIGQYFMNQLLESKHRGAFEMAYAGFVTMMDMLWRNPIDAVRELPVKWLGQVMGDIQSEDGKSKLCATRRSAGVPFFVRAVLATEPQIVGRSKFKTTMTELLAFALLTVEELPDNTDVQVHALNILGALYRDRHLSKDVAPFVADGLKAAILGFSSRDWAIRNSSTLLFSALMTRIFGVKRSKDHGASTKKNCLTGRNFFQRFPSLYPFLLEQLDAATSDFGTEGHVHLHPGLYPVLMVLGRLVPSVMEGGDTSLNMAAFVPSIIRCSSSPVLKIRLMAARALQPLVFKDQVLSVLNDLTDKLPAQPDTMTQNHIHGLLLQIKEVLSCQDELSPALREAVLSAIPSRLQQRAWLLSRSNRCVLSRQEMVHTVCSVLKLGGGGPQGEGLRACLHSSLEQEVRALSGYNPHTPALTDFLVTVTQSYLTCAPCPSGQLLTRYHAFLTCGHYEVREAALEALLTCLTFVQCEGPGPVTDAEVRNQSPQLLALLLTRLFREENWDACLAKICDVLTIYPTLPEMLELQQYDSRQVFSRVLDLAQGTKNDMLKSYAIQFSGEIFHLVYPRAVTQPVTEGLSALLQSWVGLLQNSCPPDGNDVVKRTVANAIVTNAIQLLMDPQTILGSHSLRMWDMVFQLLQEEDSEVRERMTAVLSAFDHNAPEPVQPALAVDLLLEAMILSQLPVNPEGCFHLLLDLMTRDSSSVSVGEEGVFDKGELNTYSEEVTMTAIAARHLTTLMQLARETTNTCTESHPGNRVASPADLPSLVEAAVEDVCVRLDSVLSRCEGRCTLEDVFVRTAGYQGSVALVSRLVVTLCSLTACVPLRALSDQCYRTIQKVTDTFGSETCNSLMAGHLSLLQTRLSHTKDH